MCRIVPYFRLLYLPIRRKELLFERFQHCRALFTCARLQDKPTLTLFTKSNEQCSLCTVAKDELEEYMGLVNFEEVYIDEPGNEQWKRKYQYDIPVFHFNGEYLMKHSAKPDLLEKALENYKNKKAVDSNT